MCSLVTSIRMPPGLLEELKTLARQETARTGETVTWAKLLREGARRTLREAKKGAG
jgi:hypothetical protein